ncbi:nuclear transport factor 2 family protein [Thiofilum flexile]|uniref:nuclear transport factor 2 family protein n=1 Tax=Thiofilum flexile TaxID=125627 RepID=UPI00037EC027|nr:nuclear transport factor 2 family protein [Thiofilum flexile]
MSKLNIVVKFLRVLSEGGSPESLREFYHPQAIQTEFPNLLTKVKVDRNTEELITAAEQGKKVLTSQHYEILKSYEFGNVVVIEAAWTGVLAIPIGKKVAGDTMSAQFAQFYEFEDDLILKQRNYDCFENFI